MKNNDLEDKVSKTYLYSDANTTNIRASQSIQATNLNNSNFVTMTASNFITPVNNLNKLFNDIYVGILESTSVYDPGVLSYSCIANTIRGLRFFTMYLTLINALADGQKRQIVWLPFNVHSNYKEVIISMNGNIWAFSAEKDTNALYAECTSKISDTTNYIQIKSWVE